MGIEAALIGGGASLLGSAMSADAAGDAADAQAQSAREANQLSREQFEAIRSDLAPYRNLGSGAANMLASYLGISPELMGGRSGGSGASYDAIRSELLPQFTSQTRGPDKIIGWGGEFNSDAHTVPGDMVSTVNEQGLNEAIQQRMREFAAQQSTGPTDPKFGSLLRNFTGDDLANEPGYQFGLNQGMQALDRRLASGGNYFSGAALKGAQRFGQDYAGTKFGEAFNRDSANKTRIYNFLTGATSTGQNAAAQTGNAGSAMAQQVGANTMGAANAAGAAQIAGSNAWAGGLNNIANTYNQNELLNRITGGNTGWTSNSLMNGPSNNASMYGLGSSFDQFLAR